MTHNEDSNETDVGASRIESAGKPYASRLLESPAEARFLCGLLLFAKDALGVVVRPSGANEPLSLMPGGMAWMCEQHILTLWCRRCGFGFAVFSQFPISGYRADFVLGCRGAAMVVEVDGHDWHERTKGQAARDRERDRAMLAIGYPVVRFTGSQLHEDPAECARRSVETFYAITRRQSGRSILSDADTGMPPPGAEMHAVSA